MGRSTDGYMPGGMRGDMDIGSNLALSGARGLRQLMALRQYYG